MIERVRTLEVIFNDYVEMQKNENKFEKFLNNKYKQDNE